MTPPRRAKLVLLVLACALVGLGVWGWESLWWWVMTEKHFRGWERGETRGWQRRSRETGLLLLEQRFCVLSGFKTLEMVGKGDMTRTTEWSKDGRVLGQWQIKGAGANITVEECNDPPWWWGITDQSAPSAPAWILDDDEWYTALDAQD